MILPVGGATAAAIDVGMHGIGTFTFQMLKAELERHFQK